MTDDLPQPPDDAQQPADDADAASDQFSQQVQHVPVSARVGDAVARGVFSTGVLVQTGRHEFVLDFLLMVVRPHQVVARIVLPFAAIPGFIRALRENLDAYTQRFGTPPALPKPPADAVAPPIEEVYHQLKFPDEVAVGTYANAVLITHSPSEFVFDFIANFYPRSSVSARIFLTTPQVPRFLESLSRSFDQLQRRLNEQQQQQRRPSAPPTDDRRRAPGDDDSLPRPPGPESLA